jgi:transketolase
MTRARFGRGGEGPGHHLVYGVVSDGDLMEGISAEAGSIAGHLGLGNLVYLYDDNHITIDGPTRLSFSEDVGKRFEAQRWHVQRVDGEDLAGVRAAIAAARAETERPSIVLMRTTIGLGAPHKAGTSKAHGAPLGPEETRLAKENLGWPQEPAFLVPDDVRRWFADRIAAKRAARASADAELDAWRAAHPELAASWDASRARKLPSDLVETLSEGLATKDAATRQHSAEVLQRIEVAAPFVVGGSADLAESNLTRLEHGGDVGPAVKEGEDPFAGRNLHFGIREHAMGAIVNGINLDHTFRAYGGTFLVFSDYMRPSIRLAALMGVPSIYVFTHDSIFLGEDGPTHQPIEQLDALRAIPGLTVLRPADGIETALAWAWILEQAKGPALLALTRQKLPALRRPATFAPRDVWRGAYELEAANGRPDVVLVASGSEVSVATGAAASLREGGLAVRVVSAPSLELFAAQPDAYRASVLPADGTPIVAVEASLAHSYLPFLGTRGSSTASTASARRPPTRSSRRPSG